MQETSTTTDRLKALLRLITRSLLDCTDKCTLQVLKQLPFEEAKAAALELEVPVRKADHSDDN